MKRLFYIILILLTVYIGTSDRMNSIDAYHDKHAKLTTVQNNWFTACLNLADANNLAGQFYDEAERLQGKWDENTEEIRDQMIATLGNLGIEPLANWQTLITSALLIGLDIVE